jgi:glyoxylase-like metal-dependent hydrolase (beta-lactamase superfamily II)
MPYSRVIVADSRTDKYTRLREYLETYPIEENDNRPLNPNGELQYYVICTHCHYDHIGGISQFLPGGTTQIIASSAGKNFIESDLETHGQFKFVGAPVPWYKITCWADSFERLQWPLWHEYDGEPQPFQTDLAMSIIHTPGHTPDELAWYDHEEMHLSCGDSFYEEGEDGMPIIFPAEGNLIEWVFSMQKLLVFVRSENARAAAAAESGSELGWACVTKRE